MPLIADFGKAVALGFAVAAPVGPIGLLCIRRSLTDGPAAGFATGLGAACADLLYALCAAAGLTAVALRWQWLQPAGAVMLFWIGVQTWRSARPAGAEAQTGSDSLPRAFLGTFVLTLLNPMTILTFAAMLAAIGATDPRLLAPGVFLGSAAWWLLLSSVASRLRPWLEGPRLIWLNRGAALLLAGLAVQAL